MKKMTCKQLGGACELEFQANTFEEITKLSKEHGTKMFQEKDELHLRAMDEMRKLMTNPEAMNAWFEAKRKQFDSIPEER